MNIPTNYIEFLHWVKETTETFWSKAPETTEEDFVCEEWIYGAKWQGLSDEEIDAIENEYNIKFTAAHRAFLKILHAIDKKELVEYTESFEDDAELLTEERPFFYDWKEDKEIIESYFKWPYETIFEDVLGPNKVWLKSWGTKRPASNEKKEEIFAAWFNNVPKLIPIKGHRFVVSDPLEEDNPVLSVWGSDIIVYGWNMRHYLLSELQDHLGLRKLIYDEEFESNCVEPIEVFQDIHDFEYEQAKNKNIPVIEEMILYLSSGWSSFGRKYPHANEGNIQPIVKTFIPEDEEDLNQLKKHF